MSQHENNGLVIEKLTDGVLYVTGSAEELKREINQEGTIYKRFMDNFYLDRDTNKLQKEQVLALCRKRATLTGCTESGTKNNEVKNILATLITNIAPNTALELGSGITPIIVDSAIGDYILCDTDKEIIEANNALNKKCCLFDDSCSLPFPDSYFEIISALFVFHFKIYENQFNEIARCITNDGVLIANIYWVDQDARDFIKTSLEDRGLNVRRVADLRTSCHLNEYMLASRNNSKLDDYVDLLDRVLKETVES